MKATNYRLVYENLSKLKDALDNNDKKTFEEIFSKEKLTLHNSAIGDSFLLEAIEKIYSEAIEKFILEVK